MPQERWRDLRLLFRAAPLPPPIYAEFIDMLFSMRLPVVAMGLVYVGVTGLIFRQWGDPFVAALGAGAALVTAARFLTIGAYQRARAGADAAQLGVWEARYAIGNFAFAVLLGLLNVYALAKHDPILHLITVSLVFGFGAGIVSRISVRPVICVISLLLATVPTVAALAGHAFMPDAPPLHVEMFAFEAVVVAMITALSLQTVAHLYRSAVVHHTAKHDMGLLATRDALTGLPNRLLLRERFLASLAGAKTGGRLAVHFIDLDGFKAVNDGHGHPMGDLLLEQVSRRLESAIRAEDTVARLGGDEFVVLQTNVGHEDEAEMLARRMLKKLSDPYEVGGNMLRISASAGIAMTPEFGPDLEGLIASADAALYQSKGRGKGRVHFCTQENGSTADSRLHKANEG